MRYNVEFEINLPRSITVTSDRELSEEEIKHRAYQILKGFSDDLTENAFTITAISSSKTEE